MELTRDPASAYAARAATHVAARDAAVRRARALSNGRLAAFALLVLAIGWASTSDGAARGAALASSVAALALFAWLVRAHARVRATARWHGRLLEVAMLGEARVRRDWERLPQRTIDWVTSAHPYARDLDVLGGAASLLALTDTVSAFPGRPALVRFLTEGARDAAEVAARQAASRELAGRAELRETLHALARATGELRRESFERFLEWAEGSNWLERHRGLRAAAWVVPALTIGGIVLATMGWVDARLVLLPLGAGLLIVAKQRRKLHETLDAAANRAIGLRQHAPMLALIEKERFDAPLLATLRDRIADHDGASAALRRLDAAVGLAESKAGGLGYAVLALVLLWDVHAVAALERWRAHSGHHVRGWLAALGELEALAATGTLAYDNPDFTFPEVIDPAPAFDRLSTANAIVAEALGHPLLPAGTRVANDVEVGPPGTILLVTGSNMSGKSTLLRAIGTNVVLAQAGAPVCARRMRMPLTRLHTSMRVQDSLAQGLSLFMAELERIRDVVTAARAERERPSLTLLDEILHGTNTAERQIAARTVLEHLVHAGAMSVVTTHDLALAAAGHLSERTRNAHFQESFVADESGATRMTFDYRLRPGVATSANALKLLEMVGLI